MTDPLSEDAARIREIRERHVGHQAALGALGSCVMCEVLDALTRSEQARQEAEQQRDEAREAAQFYNRIAADAKILRNHAESALANLTAERDALLRQQTSLSEERNQANLDFTLAHGRAERLEIECQQLRAALEALVIRLGYVHRGVSMGYDKELTQAEAALRGQETRKLMSETTIYKYKLQPTGAQKVLMPHGAKILCAQNQHGQVTLWAEVRHGAPDKARIIRIVSTGHPMPTGLLIYIGTVQQPPFVWHVYEEIVDVS